MRDKSKRAWNAGEAAHFPDPLKRVVHNTCLCCGAPGP